MHLLILVLGGHDADPICNAQHHQPIAICINPSCMHESNVLCVRLRWQLIHVAAGATSMHGWHAQMLQLAPKCQLQSRTRVVGTYCTAAVPVHVRTCRRRRLGGLAVVSFADYQARCIGLAFQVPVSCSSSIIHGAVYRRNDLSGCSSGFLVDLLFNAGPVPATACTPIEFTLTEYCRQRHVRFICGLT